ncbi:hypothetical protein Tco_1055907 [Tanacetum coccineum]|uniref:DUF4283 domain-containing protein n=1 Tax=Tanacetum coccineum TaxID=301880 RepID=A0ABQ5H1M9_9ASTR
MKVVLLYPLTQLRIFRISQYFNLKCCLKEAFTRAPDQYVKYLAEFWYTAKTLEGSKIWVSTPTGGIISINIGKRLFLIHLFYLMPKYDIEELTINPTQVFSVHNWTLKPNQHEEPPFTIHMKAICNLDVPVDSKAPKPSSQTKEVPQGKKLGAKSGLRRKQSSKHTSESKTEASKSKTGQLEKDTQSSLAMDKSPSHLSPPTPVVGERLKEAQQAAGGPTSLGATSEEGAHPQLNSDMSAFNSYLTWSNPSDLVDKTKSARDGLKTAHTESGSNKESRADDLSKKIKLEDLSEFLKDTRSAFFTPDSLQDEPIIVIDESEEEEADKGDTHDTSHDVPEDTPVLPPTSPNLAQIQDLMAQRAMNVKFEKKVSKSVTFPRRAKAQGSKSQGSALFVSLDKPIIVSEASEEEETERYKDTHTTFHNRSEDTLIPHPPSLKSVQIQELMAQVQLLQSQKDKLFATIIENASTKATDKGIPIVGYASASLAEEEKNINQATKDADNSKGKEVMSSKDAKDEETESNSKDDHANPAETITESSKQKKLKKFSFVTEGGEQIHLTAKKIEEQKRIEKSLKGELAKQEVEKVKSKLVNLMGIDVVTQYYNMKLMYDKYYDKVLKRRQSSKITNCNVLTTKGPITLKVYREDGTNEVISNLKVSDLHLAE